jgi:uncharacterized protein YkwD
VYASTYLTAGWRANLAMLLAAALLQTAHAGVLEAANAIRRLGCEGRPGVAVPLRRTAALDSVARRWARGGRLRAAEAAENHHSRRSVSIKFSARTSDAVVMGVLRTNQCRALTDPQFRDAGLALSDGMAWLVLAEPYQLPTIAAATELASEVLKLVNHARSAARSCGGEKFAAAPPLRASALLTRVASGHADDMARNNFLAHEGSDQSTPARRADRAGYRWKLIGENVAGGPDSAVEVVDGWLASPGHCRNIMNRHFTEMGIAYAVDERSELAIYWSQVFGLPR